jgi:hypothetical protein
MENASLTAAENDTIPVVDNMTEKDTEQSIMQHFQDLTGEDNATSLNQSACKLLISYSTLNEIQKEICNY